MKIAITGATGLIGRRVAARLAREHELVRMGRSDESDVRIDFTKPHELSSIGFHGADAVVHCAGIVDEDFKRDRVTAYTKNTASIAAFVDAARKSGVRRFVYVSSAHVYGPLEGKIDETTPPNPLSDYAIAHFAAEQILRRNASNDFLVTILRPCAVYGEPLLERFDRWSLIPFSFPLEAVQNEEIVLRSSGEQHRNFIATDDIAEEIHAVLAAEEESFRVINPIGADSMSVFQFAELTSETYQKLTGRPCAVRRPEPRAEESAEALVYQSRNAYHRARQRVSTFVQEFMMSLIQSGKGRSA